MRREEEFKLELMKVLNKFSGEGDSNTPDFILMEIEIHSLYWPNTNPEIVESHKKVMKHFELPCNYHEKQIDHGLWMDEVLRSAKTEIVIFFDIDCVPISKEKFIEYIKYVHKNKTFLGIAQVSNHIAPAQHVYAAPAFYIIDKMFYNKLNVSFSAQKFGDVGEMITYYAEKERYTYRCLYPTHYYDESTEGLWKLHNYGWYGVGTVFDNNIFHLYQSRFDRNVNLFKTVCDNIINDNFSFNNFQSATRLN